MSYGSRDDLPRSRRQSESGPTVAFWLLMLALLAGAGWFAYTRGWLDPIVNRVRDAGGGRAGEGATATVVPRPVDTGTSPAKAEELNTWIYETASPSVVHVHNIAVARGNPFAFNLMNIERGSGTGFVWDEDGHIVTNAHVVEGADKVRVVMADQTPYESDDIRRYPDKDLAVVKIKPKGKLKPIRIGESDELKVGQCTWAIGNPFGLDQSLSTGIVSALNRQIKSPSNRAIDGVIQTTAPINPGNSGGPLLDRDARLIGVNTAIASPSGAFAGIGFAIPVEEVNRIIPQLVAARKVTKPRLGVAVVNDQVARRAGIRQGVVIAQVIPGGPAAKAGLVGASDDGEVRDIIVAIEGQPIRTGDDLFKTLEKQNVGDTVRVKVIRDGKERDVPVTLAAAPD